MFAIFYTLFSASMASVEKIRKKQIYENNRDKAFQNKELTYYGDNGERLVSNDRSVYRKTVNGEKVLADLYTGEIYKNFTKEENAVKEQKYINKGKTVIPIDYDELQKYNKTMRNLSKDYLLKPSYKDIKTDQYYIIAYINGIGFYMDIITGEIIRPYDDVDISNKWGKLSIEKIIMIFNSRQKKINMLSKDSHDSIWWDKNFYLKDNYNILIIDDNEEIIYGKKNDKNIKKLKEKLMKERVIDE